MRPKPKRTVSETAEFIEIRDAAEWLGVPFSSLRHYVSRGLLPSYKLGRHRLFRKPEILAALRQTTKATLDEILR
jgi:excisionase family DNA binding protein